MVITSEFEYFCPKTLKEAVALLGKTKGTHALAGGTDLVGLLKEGRLNPAPKALVDIKNLKELKGIKLKGKTVEIGALTTFSELISSKVILSKCPIVSEAAMTVASVAVRNRATMAGNICSAVPCMDSGAILMVYDAVIVLKSKKGERKVKINDWFKAPRKTALKPGELLTKIILNLPKEKCGYSYIKLGRYQGEDLAQASLAVLVNKNKEVRVAYGSVAPTPVRAKKIESLLNKKELTDELICAAQKIVKNEISPITDIRASKEYRLHMSEVMLKRALLAAESRLNLDGPKLGAELL